MNSSADTLLPAHQERSRATRDRILEAGEELLAEAGWEGFALAEVSRRADVAIGSIYQRVTNKEGLVRAINDRTVSRLEAENRRFEDSERWRALASGELIEEVVREIARQFQHNEALLRALIRYAASDPVMAARGAAASEDLSRRFADLLLTRRQEIAHVDPEEALEVAYAQVYSSLAWRVAWGGGFFSSRPLSWRRFAAGLAQTCRAYLLGSEGPSEGCRG